jgi:hypothetical protein
MTTDRRGDMRQEHLRLGMVVLGAKSIGKRARRRLRAQGRSQAWEMARKIAQKRRAVAKGVGV